MCVFFFPVGWFGLFYCTMPEVAHFFLKHAVFCGEFPVTVPSRSMEKQFWEKEMNLSFHSYPITQHFSFKLFSRYSSVTV